MVQTILRKLPEKEARELIVTIGQARSYMQQNLWGQVEASLYRLYHVENRLRELLGEQQTPHVCYHQCVVHMAVKPELFHSSNIQTVETEAPKP